MARSPGEEWPAKKPYVKPRLERLGLLRQITGMITFGPVPRDLGLLKMSWDRPPE